MMQMYSGVVDIDWTSMIYKTLKMRIELRFRVEV